MEGGEPEKLGDAGLNALQETGQVTPSRDDKVKQGGRRLCTLMSVQAWGERRYQTRICECQNRR